MFCNGLDVMVTFRIAYHTSLFNVKIPLLCCVIFTPSFVIFGTFILISQILLTIL